MTVKEIKALAKIRLMNNSLSKDENLLMSLISLGISELYRRFNLSIKSETVEIDSHRSVYELLNEDVQLILHVYDVNGKEYIHSDTTDTRDFDIKFINYKTFVLRRPFNGYLYVVYKADSVKLVDDNDVIDLPNAMFDALLCYMSYMISSTINRDNVNESSANYQRYQSALQELEMQGYRVNVNTESLGVYTKGYV